MWVAVSVLRDRPHGERGHSPLPHSTKHCACAGHKSGALEELLTRASRLPKLRSFVSTGLLQRPALVSIRIRNTLLRGAAGRRSHELALNSQSGGLDLIASPDTTREPKSRSEFGRFSHCFRRLMQHKPAEFLGRLYRAYYRTKPRIRQSRSIPVDSYADTAGCNFLLVSALFFRQLAPAMFGQ